MASLDDYKTALLKAHKAGDFRAATLFANAIKSMLKQKTPDISEREAILSDEGSKKNEEGQHIVYKDSLGKLTGGYGHLLEGGDWKEGDVLTDEQVDEWFEKDLATAKEDVKAILGDSEVPDEVRNVLTNMAFQMGRGRLMEFDETLAAAKEGNYAKMSEKMLDSEWAKQTPNRAERLSNHILQLSKDGG